MVEFFLHLVSGDNCRLTSPEGENGDTRGEDEEDLPPLVFNKSIQTTHHHHHRNYNNNKTAIEEVTTSELPNSDP